MPHAFVNSLKNPIVPAKTGNFELKGFFYSPRYSLAVVSVGGNDFSLCVKQKKDGYLIKPDKLTRPSSLEDVKLAVAAFCSNYTDGIVKSNLSPKKQVEKSKKLLEPSFFALNKDFFDTDISVEVGFGSGRHLLHRAKEEPDKKFIGVEIYKPSIEQVLRQCELQNIQNIYVVDFDARILIDSMPSGSLSEVFVHFPVPWPGSPHRRVISKTFLESCSSALKEGGYIELRSDDKDYFDYAFSCATSLKKAKIETLINEEALIRSKYEDRWLRQGKDIFEMRIYPQTAIEEMEYECDFCFESTNDKALSLDALPQKPYLENDILINFEDRFLGENGDFALKVTFGDKHKPQRKYIISNGGDIAFYPSKPIFTKTNAKAFTIIKEFLYGKK